MWLILAKSVRDPVVSWARNQASVNIVMAAAWKPYQLDRLSCDPPVDTAQERANTISILVWNATAKDKM